MGSNWNVTGVFFFDTPQNLMALPSQELDWRDYSDHDDDDTHLPEGASYVEETPVHLLPEKINSSMSCTDISSFLAGNGIPANYCTKFEGNSVSYRIFLAGGGGLYRLYRLANLYG